MSEVAERNLTPYFVRWYTPKPRSACRLISPIGTGKFAAAGQIEYFDSDEQREAYIANLCAKYGWLPKRPKP